MQKRDGSDQQEAVEGSEPANRTPTATTDQPDAGAADGCQSATATAATAAEDPSSSQAVSPASPVSAAGEGLGANEGSPLQEMFQGARQQPTGALTSRANEAASSSDTQGALLASSFAASLLVLPDQATSSISLQGITEADSSSESAAMAANAETDDGTLASGAAAPVTPTMASALGSTLSMAGVSPTIYQQPGSAVTSVATSAVISVPAPAAPGPAVTSAGFQGSSLDLMAVLEAVEESLAELRREVAVAAARGDADRDKMDALSEELHAFVDAQADKVGLKAMRGDLYVLHNGLKFQD